MARGRGERGEGARAALRASGSGPQLGAAVQHPPCPLLFSKKNRKLAAKHARRSSLAMQHADAEPGSLLGKQKKSAADKLPV